ncbi:MAG TPA: DUF4118 domain-containing protein [Trichocoleus sp.]|jgi:K+-sensing histidine kinase KdpD
MSLDWRFLSYAVAIGSTVIALLLRLWLDPVLAGSLDAFFYISVTITAWSGGFKPGIIAVVLSTLAIDYFFVPPISQFGIEQAADGLQLGIFLFVALTISLLSSNLKDSKQKIQKLNQQFAEKNADQLSAALRKAQADEQLLQQQFKQQRIVMEMTQRIRQFLDLQNILQATVDEVRQFLQIDRVIIFQLTSDWRGAVTVESVVDEVSS